MNTNTLLKSLINYSREPKVLSIAGSDSGGGAGIQADLKTFSALGCYGTSVITAVTAQNTTDVRGVYPMTASQVGDQIRAVFEDIGADAIKLGMLFSPEIIRETARCLREWPEIPVVLDPVMIAKSGDRLLQDDAVDALSEELFPLASVVTPNIPEAEVLSGIRLAGLQGKGWDDVGAPGAMDARGAMDALDARGAKDAGDHAEAMAPMARKMMNMGARSVVMKGGHLEGDEAVDVLFHEGKTWTFRHPRVNTPNTHGTGCTYSSAIASTLAHGLNLPEAVQLANEYLYEAICAGANRTIGNGHGPVDHFFVLKEAMRAR